MAAAKPAAKAAPANLTPFVDDIAALPLLPVSPPVMVGKFEMAAEAELAMDWLALETDAAADEVANAAMLLLLLLAMALDVEDAAEDAPVAERVRLPTPGKQIIRTVSVVHMLHQ